LGICRRHTSETNVDRRRALLQKAFERLGQNLLRRRTKPVPGGWCALLRPLRRRGDDVTREPLQDRKTPATRMKSGKVAKFRIETNRHVDVGPTPERLILPEQREPIEQAIGETIPPDAKRT